ncbi:HNH endonuclease (plasmid) [Halarchaeum sp. CBA1220]|uniref:HNH endonuclease n=1 Tax=Halarchaeum sp. CBA1220 TaxID=1853682 RepID=UPI000F3A890D|nr:HNH endonuclease [Halarchaeum sp. CBA1220]QLC35679.1 HNH endonuclease [Halarchaeum sp. CBA1220]
MQRAFRVGEVYRDTGSFRNADDQFLRWIRGPLSSGIKNVGGIRDLGADRADTPAALVLVSNDSGVSQHEDPWEDTLAVNRGEIHYWGDAKMDNPYDESSQNRKITDAFDDTASGHREEVPPVLVFRKPESGVVEFCGLCAPDHFEVRSYQDGSGTQIPNYLFHFSVLNTEAVPVSWLHDRAQMNDDRSASDVWRHWVETGEVSQWPTGETRERSGRVRTYETSGTVVSDAFRDEAFERFGHACVMTGIREDDLLDLAHVLPRSQRPDLAEDAENVLVLNALHHRAFDAALFTIDSDYRIRASPSFDPAHPFLKETIVDRRGERLALPPDARVQPTFLEELNEGLSWL